MPITAEYDREADALYVRLRDGERQRAVEIDDSTYVDVDGDDRPVGIELLYPALGLNLETVVRRFSLEQQLSEILTAIGRTDAPVSPPTMTGGQLLASTSIVTVSIEGTVGAARCIASPGIGHADPFISAGAPSLT
jgi:uncharacterized protein YuzE